MNFADRETDQPYLENIVRRGESIEFHGAFGDGASFKLTIQSNTQLQDLERRKVLAECYGFLLCQDLRKRLAG